MKKIASKSTISVVNLVRTKFVFRWLYPSVAKLWLSFRAYVFVIQFQFIHFLVNEKGSEAAAATAVVVLTFSGSMPQRWKGNQPFVYTIWTGRKLLFAGEYFGQ